MSKVNKNDRRICVKCKRKKYIKYMIEVGTERGSRFQRGETITLYQCKPDIFNRDKCRK